MKLGQHTNWMRATKRAIGKCPKGVALLDWFNKACNEGALRYDKATDTWLVVRIVEESERWKARHNTEAE